MESSRATVEVAVFSGRRNPSFVLDADTTRSLLGILASLPISSGTRLPDPGLGYRGFNVEVGSTELRVLGELVEDESTSVVRRDDDRRLERLLARWVLEHGDPGLAGLLPDS